VALDRSAETGTTYFYRLATTYRDGSRELFGPLSATAGRPITEFALAPIAPNPTEGAALIEYAVPNRADVTVAMFDLQGRKVATLASGSHAPGLYQVTWNGDLDGRKAKTGVYFLRMVSPTFSKTRRLVVSH